MFGSVPLPLTSLELTLTLTFHPLYFVEAAKLPAESYQAKDMAKIISSKKYTNLFFLKIQHNMNSSTDLRVTDTSTTKLKDVSNLTVSEYTPASKSASEVSDKEYTIA